MHKQHHIVSKLGSFLKRAFIASMPLFGAAKSTQYPPSPFDMIVALTNSRKVRIISTSHINNGWNENRPPTSIWMIPLKCMPKHKRRWNSSIALLHLFNTLLSSPNASSRKVNPMPRIAPVRHAIAKLPRLADVHQDVVQVELPRHCEAALHVGRLQALHYREPGSVCNLGGWWLGPADGCVGRGEDEGVV